MKREVLIAAVFVAFILWAVVVIIQPIMQKLMNAAMLYIGV